METIALEQESVEQTVVPLKSCDSGYSVSLKITGTQYRPLVSPNKKIETHCEDYCGL